MQQFYLDAHALIMYHNVNPREECAYVTCQCKCAFGENRKKEDYNEQALACQGICAH